MEQSEVPIWKWVAAALSIIIICFFVGYFLLGPSARAPITDAPDTTAHSSSGAAKVTTVVPDVEVDEKTAQIQAQRKAEIEKRKKQQEDERKRKEQELANERAKEAEKIPADTATVPADEITNPPAKTDTTVPATSATIGNDPGANPADKEKPKPPLAEPPGPTPEKKQEPTEPKLANPPGPPAANPDNANPPRTSIRRRRDRTQVAAASTVTNPTPSTPDRGQESSAIQSPLYRVVLQKVFPKPTSGDSVLEELHGRNYQTTWHKESGTRRTAWRIQLGAYHDEKGARDLAQELTDNGYQVIVKKDTGG